MKCLVAVIVLALSCTLTLAQRVQETVQENLELTSGGQLTLVNVNGNIQVRSWSRDEVQLVALKQASGDSPDQAEDLLAATEIVIDHSPSRIDIRTELPRRSRRRGGNVSVDYELTVPERADLALTSTNGNVVVEEVDGAIELRTTNGKIKAVALRGRVQASTTNGSIEAELLEFDEGEDLEFSTTNGSITLAVPSRTRARVRASTTNGGIRTDFPLQVQGRYRGKSVEGDLNGGGALIRLSTTNGSIRIRESAG